MHTVQVRFRMYGKIERLEHFCCCTIIQAIYPKLKAEGKGQAGQQSQGRLLVTKGDRKVEQGLLTIPFASDLGTASKPHRLCRQIRRMKQ